MAGATPTTPYKPLVPFQVVLVGPAGCGKSTLLTRMTSPSRPFEGKYVQTYLPDVHQRVLPRLSARVTVWDLPVLEATSAHHILAAADACVFVYDTTSAASYEALKHDVIPRVRHRLGSRCRCFVLVGTKSDVGGAVQVPESTAHDYAHAHGMEHVTTSARHNWGIDALLDVIIEQCNTRRVQEPRRCSCCIQ